MPLSSGSRLGPYEIVSSLGCGGMGEVYRARDTRLCRIVAIKTLRADLSSDADLRRRFEREAEPVVMSVPLALSEAEAQQAPRPLFRVGSRIRDFDVTKDGQRFVLNCDVGTPSAPLVNIVINWTYGLPPQQP